MLAKDIMQRTVVTARPEMGLKEVGRLLRENKITGAPVVDGRGHLVGVISQTDLVTRKTRSSVPSSSSFWDPESAADIIGLPRQSADFSTVREAMTRAVFTAAENTPITNLMNLMVRERIHRVAITDGERLVGIVTTMDVIRGMAVWAEEHRGELENYVLLP